jgi:hypothetical protein
LSEKPCGAYFFAFFENFFVPILTSGGPASFIMPLQIGKTPIVVPRQHQFNEHVNDHQVEFARNVAKRMGTIIEVEDIETLGDVITNYDQIVAGMQAAMATMAIGELVTLALETLVVSWCLKILSVVITVIMYGRMIEIYLYTSLAPIPFATMSNREWGHVGTNYFRGLFALAFQAFLMMVCVAIYAALEEAEKYLGMPYVWGGSSPSTSFDCSGFVCWVINNSGNGWSVGRTTANGLRGKCSYVSPADAQPGDLIFFEKTYNTVGASHVGIYVGNGMMIHCGDPISYTSINSTYWQSHFLGFGRIN